MYFPFFVNAFLFLVWWKKKELSHILCSSISHARKKISTLKVILIRPPQVKKRERGGAQKKFKNVPKKNINLVIIGYKSTVT